jgi:putative tryptophan/tyrosine transport system substrate-binding protein
LHELLPTAGMIVALLNPDNPNAHTYALQAQAAADALGLRLQVLTAHAEADLEAAFGIMVQGRADALLVIADPFFIARRQQVVALVAEHAMPAIYPIRWFSRMRRADELWVCSRELVSAGRDLRWANSQRRQAG